MMASHNSRRIRNLILVLGDQLDEKSAAFQDFDKKHDAVWMAESAMEAKYVWSHQSRIALFLTAMRHFRDSLRSKGIAVHYQQLGDPDMEGSLGEYLEKTVKSVKPQRLVVTEPGEWRVRQALIETARQLAIALDIRPDKHFLCSTEDFDEHVRGRHQLRMEYFYREMRKRTGILTKDDKPVGERWNFDAENRRAFGKKGPTDLPAPIGFSPDALTREVFTLVKQRFGDHPGKLEHFDWPISPKQARQALDDFVSQRLPHFGAYQDAMWNGAPYLYHSRMSAALNLKLLDPRDVLAAAEKAYRSGSVSLAAAEGFVRQILGWREYVRGVYWHWMPEYLGRNGLSAARDLPAFFWSGSTTMNCLRQVITQSLDYGYAHHIQRLMVTGLFCILLGVHPRKVHEWYLAIYVDAVEWVELPNTLGMSQYADGGVMASKPYVASGNYIRRMSNYCESCRYRPDKATGESACPFTTLYWDFLRRHKAALTRNQRMRLQLKNLSRFTSSDLAAVRKRAGAVRSAVEKF